MTREDSFSQSTFLKKKPVCGITPTTFAVIIIMLLSLGLHLYNIESIGDANAYYTAAVKSMLQSWSNFFFVAAEPGGSVSVDKPPLGLWVEAVFAYFLGVSGFSVSLPNIIAGILNIPLLYHLVNKYADELAGIVAAFVMSTTPIFIATNRNNTMDGTLIFVLLVAAWAFIKATESGRLRYVLIGVFIIGIGFNIKMMQAFLPLPSFYALYFFGSKEAWHRKVINLSSATILLIAVSLSWAIVVDLTPAKQRPYIGSSNNNTVMGLIFGYNGLSRLENTRGGGQAPPSASQAGTNPNQPTQHQQGIRQAPPQEALDACAKSAQDDSCTFTLQDEKIMEGLCLTPPNLEVVACVPRGATPQNSRTPFTQETGEPGIFRFFIDPLSKQMSWLLPFALISTFFSLFVGKIRIPFEDTIHKAAILWGGWLLTCIVFFSMVSGIFHAYYTIMLAPPLGAMAGIGFSQLWKWGKEKSWADVLLIVSALITFGFQLFAIHQYEDKSGWVFVAGLLFVMGIILMVVRNRLAYLITFSAMMIIPIYWTAMTVAANPDINLPTAYLGSDQQQGYYRGPNPSVTEEMIEYLKANTDGMKYLAAVPSSQQGSQIVLATGRPVLFIGGFAGQDEVVTPDDLAAMVTNSELRYILYADNRDTKQDIAVWLKSSCAVMLDFSEINTNTDSQQGSGSQPMTLFMCR